MEKSFLENYIQGHYIPPPKDILMKPLPNGPMNTPISECSFMLESFQKICNCKDFTNQKIQEDCNLILNEIKNNCFENKN